MTRNEIIQRDKYMLQLAGLHQYDDWKPQLDEDYYALLWAFAKRYDVYAEIIITADGGQIAIVIERAKSRQEIEQGFGNVDTFPEALYKIMQIVHNHGRPEGDKHIISFAHERNKRGIS
jgi:hypothetical protein